MSEPQQLSQDSPRTVKKSGNFICCSPTITIAIIFGKFKKITSFHSPPILLRKNFALRPFRSLQITLVFTLTARLKAPDCASELATTEESVFERLIDLEQLRAFVCK